MFDLFSSDIDFSFAICPSRQYAGGVFPHQQRGERTNLYQEYSGDASVYASDDTSVDSCRSVTFADNVVSEVISVPRYERERLPELFYSSLEVHQFKQEARAERRVQRVCSLWQFLP